MEGAALGLTFERGGAWRPLAGSGEGEGLHLARVGERWVRMAKGG